MGTHDEWLNALPGIIEGEPDFTHEELAEIDVYAKEGGVNRWERPSHDERP